MKTPAGRAWIVSPAFDLLFFANLPWVICLVPGLAADPANPISFWQVYFLTTPHRWITLLLVATDPDRRDGRGRLFAGLAVLAFGLVAGTYVATGTLLCLALIDTIWNAWHFGSQHAGVLRIYGRKLGGGWPWLEKHGTRWFVFYVGLRVPGWATGYLRTDTDLHAIIRTLDLLVLSIPALLLAVQLRDFTRHGVGKLTYTASVAAVYTGLLVAVRTDAGPLVIAFALASAVFHATEYLAIVTHYAWRRQAGGPGPFRVMAANWGLVLVVFVVGLGLFEAVYGTALGEWWVGANLAAAYLHYAYDGLIGSCVDRRPQPLWGPDESNTLLVACIGLTSHGDIRVPPCGPGSHRPVCLFGRIGHSPRHLDADGCHAGRIRPVSKGLDRGGRCGSGSHRLVGCIGRRSIGPK